MILRLLVVLGFVCALLAECGVPQQRGIKIAAWAFWLAASFIWAFNG